MDYFEIIKPMYFNYVFKKENTFNMPTNIMFKGYFSHIKMEDDEEYLKKIK